MSKPTTFVVHDESLNSYGYYVKTDGIDLKQFKRNPIMLFMHNRKVYSENSSGVIGRWENIRKEGTQILADPVFDESDDFAVKLKSKVENGFIKMASIGIRVLGTSDDPKDLKKGQRRPTITKSSLFEISLVDIGSNSNALKLYAGENTEQEVMLSDILPELLAQDDTTLEKLETNNMSQLKTIALALALSAEATEPQVLQAISALKADSTALTKLKNDVQTAQDTEAATLVDRAVKKGIIPESLKAGQLAAFKQDFNGTKTAMVALLDADPNPALDDAPKPSEELGAFITDKAGTGAQKPSEKKTYAWYEKNDPSGLAKLQAEKPADFEKLLTEHLN